MRKYLHLYVVNNEKQIVKVNSVAEGLVVAIPDYYVICYKNNIWGPYYVYTSESFEDIAFQVESYESYSNFIDDKDIFVYPATDRLRDVCLSDDPLNPNIFDQKFPQYSFTIPYCVNEDGRADLID